MDQVPNSAPEGLSTSQEQISIESRHQLENQELKLQVEKLSNQVEALQQINAKLEQLCQQVVSLSNPYDHYQIRKQVINVLEISKKYPTTDELTQAGLQLGYQLNITQQLTIDFNTFQVEHYNAILISTHADVDGVQLGNSIMKWVNLGKTVVLVNNSLNNTKGGEPCGNFAGPLIIGSQDSPAVGYNTNPNHPIFRGVGKITSASRIRSVTTVNLTGNVDIAGTYTDAVPLVAIRNDLPGLIICITLYCGAGGPWCVDGGVQLIVNALSMYKK